MILLELSIPIPTSQHTQFHACLREERLCVQSTRSPDLLRSDQETRGSLHAAPNWVLKVATRRLSCRRKLIKIAVIGPLPRTLFAKGRSGESETEPGGEARAGRARSPAMQMNHSPRACASAAEAVDGEERPHASLAQEVLPDGSRIENMPEIELSPLQNFT